MKRFFNKYGHWLFLALTAVLTLYMDVFVARELLDGDASEVLCRAWQMAQERSWFVRGWRLTTEVRLLDISFVLSLFFYFTDNWMLVRVLGTAVMQAIYLLSHLYLCRQAGVGKKAAVYTAGFMLLPISMAYGRNILYHLYYLLYMANCFWMLGLTLQIVRGIGGKKRRLIVPGVLLAALWLHAGLNGVRHMMIFGVPLLLFAAIQLLLKLKDYRWENSRIVGQEPLWALAEVRLMLVLFVSCCVFMAGFLVNKLVLMPYYRVVDMSHAFYSASEFEVEPYLHRWMAILNGWQTAIGVRSSEWPLISVRGVSLMAALFGMGYLLWASVRSCTEEGAGLAHRALGSMFVLGFASTTLIFLLDTSTSRIYSLYYVPVVVLAFPTLALEMDRLRQAAASIARRLMILATCCCFLFQGAYSVYYLTVEQWYMDDWTGSLYEETDTAALARECVDFMQENDYTHAMSYYWYASTIREVSNGEITVTPVNLYSKVQVYYWGASADACRKENLPERLVCFFPVEFEPTFDKQFPHLEQVYKTDRVIGYELTLDDVGF